MNAVCLSHSETFTHKRQGRSMRNFGCVAVSQSCQKMAHLCFARLQKMAHFCFAKVPKDGLKHLILRWLW